MYKPDFIIVRTKSESKGPGDGEIIYWADYMYIESQDLMIKGGDFYAAWDDANQTWTLSENRLCEIIDSYLDWYAAESGVPNGRVSHLRDDSTNRRARLKKYFKNCDDNFVDLDSEVTFLGEVKTKEDHVSKSLPYKLEPGEPRAYNEFMSVIYAPEERQKLEWAIGAIISGESKYIQKFIVLYGESGTGKSSFLRIVDALFQGYTTTFDSRALGTGRNAFVMEVFKNNPLVGIQDDGDLSRIWDNTRLNQIVSHENVMIEEKYKSAYPKKLRTFLFMGTNRMVEITEARSGITRRLIDVTPTGFTVPPERYQVLKRRIETQELGMIAHHCLDVYLHLGPDAYNTYRPERMIGGTNRIYNFISDNLGKFTNTADKVTREELWTWYKQWVDEAGEERMKRMEFGEEMKAYYKDYRPALDIYKGEAHMHYRRVYIGFKSELFDQYEPESKPFEPVKPVLMTLDKTESILDELYADYPAQYWTEDGERLQRKWENVSTKLKDIDTSKLHAVRYEPNHIVVDFDLKNANGEKDRDLNLAAAAHWPDTYAEYSKSGAGVHLHYLYDGDPDELAEQYAPHVDIRKSTGKLCDRRKLTKCNDLPIATLSDGALPKKGEKKKMVDFDGFKNEATLRKQIDQALKRKVHKNTKPSIDWINELLEEAYASGEFYDVSDLRPRLQAFANSSTNQSVKCLKILGKMHLKSASAEQEEVPLAHIPKDGRPVVENEFLTFYDIEIFPNVFIICYKHYGEGEPVMKMVNPTPEEVRKLYDYNLVGFNNRSYDNHIIWAAGMLSYNPYQLYTISKKIIDNDPSFRKFPQAYNLSYADVFDFASAANKMGLKKWEIELGINHIENHYDWDQPLDEKHWMEVCDYCANDVLATEAVFNHLHDDYTARCILAKLGNSVPNQSTRNLMKRILFKGDKNPRDKLVYTDLSEMFPGYKYEGGVSTYRGFTVGEGGFVFAVPGMYSKVRTFDVASMHPSSCKELGYLGPYTKTYADMLEARVCIKHQDYDKARTLLDGALGSFLDDPDMDPKALSDALKTALNSLYGYTKMTSALDFVHPSNKDNIIAKRGALFMIDLLQEVQDRGGTVVHIKTDSIKVVDPAPELEEFIFSYGREYGYKFEIESDYDRFCLVNDAVYIAHDAEGWHATGTQFAEPYVFKTLFSGEPVVFDDLCVVKSVSNKGKMFIDVNKDPDPDKHDYKFIGGVGKFCPVLPEVVGGGPLVVLRGDKFNAVTGTKDRCWKESEFVREAGQEDMIDMSYFENLKEKAIEKISEFGDFDKFVKGEM